MTGDRTTGRWITGEWLTRPETRAVCEMLTGGGYRALFVGGCVRNALLGAAVADIDIATDALPERVVALAGAAGLRAVPTGIAHGTVTVLANGRAHEVTTFRRDVQTDGRHAVVAFGGTLAGDAARRDFTMNALYADPSGAVIDPLGGLPDAVARRVRFVGDPSDRIAEDRLRILRFFRFLAWYGDAPDPEGLAACAALAAGIDALSRERIGAEMRKLLTAPDPAPSVASMAQAGVLARALPGADPHALPVLVHLEAGHQPDWQRRLAVLGGDDPAGSLRLTNAEAARLRLVRDAMTGSAGPAELAYRHGAAIARDIVLTRCALMASELPAGWNDDIARGAAAVFPVRAADLMPALAGPVLGARLRELETRWIASSFSLGRSDLLR